MIEPPFNYTGSKFKLLHQLLPLFDYSKDYFVDLFCGGGSVYTNVLDKYRIVIANDIISDLIGIHEQLSNGNLDFIELSKSLCVPKDDKEGYLKLRESYNTDKTPAKLWALMLNCTNNMMRFNKKLEFNQTFGKRQWNSNTEKKVNLFINHMVQYRNSVVFRSKSFSDITIYKPSMFYIDPPYTNTEAGYNAYWSQEIENKLYTYILRLDKSKHSFMLSGVLGGHKNGERSKILYKLIGDGFKYKVLDFDYEKVARKKNDKNSKEIVIFNY